MRIDTSKDMDPDRPPTFQILMLLLAAAVVTVLGIIAMVDQKWLPW